MRTLCFVFFIMLTSGYVCAQKDNKWYRFIDTKTNLTGYKDATGKIKVSAKFGPLTRASVFRNIIAIDEEVSERNFANYYLLKTGKKVGVDSTYIWDFTFPFENEEKIIFRDKKTDRVGFFDKNGIIAIPAVYNDAMPFHNGLALVIRNAKRICWEGGEATKSNPCEHWSWKGVTSIINAKNDILVDSLDLDSIPLINWYSLKIGDNPLDNSLYINLKGVNGRVYSFVDYKREFQQWFSSKFLTIKNAKQLRQCCFKVFSAQINRRKYNDRQMLSSDFAMVSNYLNKIKNNRLQSDTESDDLYSDVYGKKGFEMFYNDIGEHDRFKYPAFVVYVGNKKNLNEESFRFLRTDYGYKLISMVLKKRN
ncbi:WG repeat-containing protein [Mucilaginibacter sp.]|uniref:WG repeat-containing protein n=1 Tax=Mucilaginibacter sp. TaxID=1882438 RepID=UPI0035BC3009